MMMGGYVTAVARVVRAAAVALSVSVIVGFIAVEAFAGQYGTPARTVLVEPQSSDGALSVAITTQESTGRKCSERPVLTDVILFQLNDADEVTVLTFDKAIEASAARTGRIRRYCV